MNKSFLFVIMMVAASFTGCIDSEDSDEILTDPVGEVNVPGNALVFTRDADSTECSNCLLYTSPSPRDDELSRMPSSA